MKLPNHDTRFPMALRATIFKADLNVADMDRNYYLTFTKGLSDIDEPDLWKKDLTGAIEHWIEVGQPDDRRILRACGRAELVTVYCYGGHASKVWWAGIAARLARARNLRVVALPAGQSRILGELAERSMAINVSIQDGTAFASTARGEASVEPEIWRDVKR